MKEESWVEMSRSRAGEVEEVDGSLDEDGTADMDGETGGGAGGRAKEGDGRAVVSTEGSV